MKAKKNPTASLFGQIRKDMPPPSRVMESKKQKSQKKRTAWKKELDKGEG